MHPTPRCVLFDLDGTLVDTAPDLSAAANAVRKARGLSPLAAAVYRPECSNGVAGMLRVALGIDPTHPDYPALRQRFLDLYGNGVARFSRPFDGALELLDQLERHGIRWGVVTNKIEGLAVLLLRTLGLLDRCACLIAGDNVSHPKPAAEPLLLACRRLGLSTEAAVYLGDDMRDIQAARAARMRSAVAAWGYLGAHSDPEGWGADAVLLSPADVAGWIGISCEHEKQAVST